MRIFKSKWFKKYTRKQNIHNDQLINAVKDANNGLIYCDYDDGLIKQQIPKPGRGKAKGHRTIIAFIKCDKAFFIYAFEKNAIDNLTQTEVTEYKNLAEIYLSMDDKSIEKLLKDGELIEVENEL
ncbi:type II toxin-antitoxin system RelE/ParE family toxin [Terasakiella pusilla]|uniref:type II toxin-antitoxin system RelE/ParE family toxin n=1 Tax=Terasakiella pusilla TaxID=64973 RepID=UPI00048F61E0|nr:type II toxin-antitoxin system RelE/ParE family toxin [Terasakiella pusilla]